MSRMTLGKGQMGDFDAEDASPRTFIYKAHIDVDVEVKKEKVLIVVGLKKQHI